MTDAANVIRRLKQRLKDNGLLVCIGYELDILEKAFEAQQREIERLRAQLPEGMEDCKIAFMECEVGHGRLTATNWIDHGCPTCVRDRLTLDLATESAERERRKDILAINAILSDTNAALREHVAFLEAREGKLREALDRIAEDEKTYLGYGDFSEEPLPGSECQKIARAALAETEKPT